MTGEREREREREKRERRERERERERGRAYRNKSHSLVLHSRSPYSANPAAATVWDCTPCPPSNNGLFPARHHAERQRPLPPGHPPGSRGLRATPGEQSRLPQADQHRLRHPLPYRVCQAEVRGRHPGSHLGCGSPRHAGLVAERGARSGRRADPCGRPYAARAAVPRARPLLDDRRDGRDDERRGKLGAVAFAAFPESAGLQRRQRHPHAGVVHQRQHGPGQGLLPGLQPGVGRSVPAVHVTRGRQGAGARGGRPVRGHDVRLCRRGNATAARQRHPG